MCNLFNKMGLIWLLVCSAMGLALIWSSLELADSSKSKAAHAALLQQPPGEVFRWTDPETGRTVQLTTRPIEKIQVGQRVIADDPDVVVSSQTAVDPKTWRKLKLEMVQFWPDGTRDDLYFETLQPLEWVTAHHIEVGAWTSVPLDLQEMGYDPNELAQVIAVEACPPIEDGPGRVVISTVNHLNAAIHELTFRNDQGEQSSVKTTRYHKFYLSATKTWIPAYQLQSGDRVGGLNADLTIVTNQHLPGTKRVYNFTVEG
jgi:hypothetical protein